MRRKAKLVNYAQTIFGKDLLRRVTIRHRCRVQLNSGNISFDQDISTLVSEYLTVLAARPSTVGRRWELPQRFKIPTGSHERREISLFSVLTSISIIRLFTIRLLAVWLFVVLILGALR